MARRVSTTLSIFAMNRGLTKAKSSGRCCRIRSRATVSMVCRNARATATPPRPSPSASNMVLRRAGDGALRAWAPMSRATSLPAPEASSRRERIRLSWNRRPLVPSPLMARVAIPDASTPIRTIDSSSDPIAYMPLMNVLVVFGVWPTMLSLPLSSLSTSACPKESIREATPGGSIPCSKSLALATSISLDFSLRRTSA